MMTRKAARFSRANVFLDTEWGKKGCQGRQTGTGGTRFRPKGDPSAYAEAGSAGRPTWHRFRPGLTKPPGNA